MNSLWGSETESFSNLTAEMKRSVDHQNFEADLKSELELLKK